MKNMMIILTLIMSTAVLSVEENFQFEDEAQRQLYIELTKELRCPKCQNQDIADSDAMIASDLRRKVFELLQQGYSHKEVIDYMRQRYGDFVTYDPAITPATLWLWLLPLLFLLGGGVVVYQHRQKGPTEVDPKRLAEAEKLLEKDQ
jgi:cytochrome c-type biogenesis protein CcmH